MSVESREMELRQLLSNLTAREPLDELLACAYCFLYEGHKDDCPWAVAQAYLHGDARA